ncbi:MAG: hypothetical protein WBB70_16840 [Desulfobacterales bacterium]
MMANIKCARCDQKVEKIKSETIELVTYCESCAKQVKQKKKEKKHKAKLEENKKIKEREYIEKELEVITEDDTKHIIVTTTDTVEVKRIGEYISVISAQEYKYNTDIPEDDRAGEKEMAEKDNRGCVERVLFKLKKQAYLLGADAIIGTRVYSNFDYDTEGGQVIAIMTKINITGTAVRLIQ